VYSEKLPQASVALQTLVAVNATQSPLSSTFPGAAATGEGVLSQYKETEAK